MEIKFSYDEKRKIELGEAIAANNRGKETPTFKKMVESNWLRNFEKNFDLKDKFLKITEIFNKQKKLELQILNLDIRGFKKSINFKDLWKNDEPNLKMGNVAFVFRADEQIFGNTNNSIVIFVSISINNSSEATTNNQFSKSVILNVQRIELLDLPYLESNSVIEATFNGKIDIKFNKENKNFDPRLIAILNDVKKIDKINQENNGKDEIKYQAWNHLIFLINNFYHDKKNDKDKKEIFVKDEKLIIDKNSKNGTFYILNKSDFDFENVTNKIQFHIFNEADTNSTTPIKLFPNPKIIELKSEYFNELNVFQDNLDNYENEIGKIKINIEEKENSYKDIKNQIKIFNKKIEKKEDTILSLKKDNDILIKKNKEDEKNKNLVFKNNLKIKQNKEKQVAEINDIKNIDIEVIDLEKEIKLIDINIKKLKEDFKKHASEIKNIETKIKGHKICIKYLGDYIVYKVKFEILKRKNNTPIQGFVIKRFIDELNEQGRITWEITTVDKGKIEVIKRYGYAFKNINLGLYKNPYLVYSMFNTPKINNSSWKKPNTTIIEKYQLNDEQKKVIEKAINTRDVFYLQGPPGTGKTHTIAAISEEYINSNKNIVITSSTHEAINNYFDRLDEMNYNNPNILLLKYRHLQEDEKFNEDKMYDHFFQKAINYGTVSTKNENELNDLINAYKEKNGSNLIDYFLPEEINIIAKLDKNKITNLANKNSRIKRLWEKIENEYSNDQKSNKDLINFFNDRIKNNYELKTIEKSDDLILNFKKIFKLSKLIEIGDSINDYKKSSDSSNFFSNYLNSLNKIMINNTDDNQKEKNKFKEFVFKNNLINVIGITTTARMSIKVSNIERSLFSDYPIDLVIIDEISKSVTPEILSRIILAKQVIFAGDYKQLPPILDFEESEVDEIYKKQTEKINSNFEIYSKEDFYEEIAKLYKTSFFKTKVEKMKNQELSKIPYQNLVIQHRFSEGIMSIVNEFYDPNEKLKMPINYSPFKEYVLKISGNSLNESIALIDTSILSLDFIELLKNTNLKLGISNPGFKNFDSNQSIFQRRHMTARINDFNAFVIAKAVKDLVEKNKNKELKNKIGIIAMTRSQTYVIDYFLKEIFNNKELENLKIKVDTVDNFQGREKEIIFVDLVRAHGSYEKDKITFNRRNLEFYKEPERLNVAFSRAKAKMIIVGSFQNHLLNKETVTSKTGNIQYFRNVYNIHDRNGALVSTNADEKVSEK